jgi:cytochrome c oxidase subunit IV
VSTTADHESHEHESLREEFHDAEVEPDTVGQDVVGGHGHPSDKFYVGVFVILAVITGLEVAASYSDLGVVFLPLLFTLMAIKFVMVVLFFMHLRFDDKIFGRLFWSGLLLAIGVYVAALATFHVFTTG